MKHPQPHLPVLLSQLSLFRGLGRNKLDSLAAATHERSHTKDGIIFRIGDRPTGLLIVTAGLVKEAVMSPDGKEKILELIDVSHSLGEAALFLDMPYSYYATALEPTRLLHIDRQALFDVAFSEPLVAKRLLKSLSAREMVLVRDVESYVVRRHVQRVACYLLGRCGDPPDNQASITLPAPKQVIAARLGMTPETFSRNLRDLVDAGLIAVLGNQIKVRNLSRLRKFAF